MNAHQRRLGARAHERGMHFVNVKVRENFYTPKRRDEPRLNGLFVWFLYDISYARTLIFLAREIRK